MSLMVVGIADEISWGDRV